MADVSSSDGRYTQKTGASRNVDRRGGVGRSRSNDEGEVNPANPPAEVAGAVAGGVNPVQVE